MKMVYQSFDTEAMSKSNQSRYTNKNSQFPIVHNQISFEVNSNRKNENFICMTSYRVNNKNQRDSDAHYNSLQDERLTDDLSEVRIMC